MINLVTYLFSFALTAGEEGRGRLSFRVFDGHFIIIIQLRKQQQLYGGSDVEKQSWKPDA